MTDEDAQLPERHRSRGWLIALAVVVAIAGAGVLGYALGGNSRDDDVKSADAKAATATEKAQSANQDAAQDEQAIQAIKDGFGSLGDAIAQEDAKDDKAAQQAVDDATGEIQSGFEQLGANFSEGLDKALADLSAKVNDAVGSGNAEQAPAAGE